VHERTYCHDVYKKVREDQRRAVKLGNRDKGPKALFGMRADLSRARRRVGGIVSKVILLVEDNPDDEALTMRALKKNNVLNKVVVARDGVEALDYLFGKGMYEGRDTSVMPQLVLLDLNLPRISGLEVLRRLRADRRTRLLPVVILTSSREQQDLLTGYGYGANSYVCKPVDFVRFSQTVQQLKLYWLDLNEPPLVEA
jgi:two-component system, response regulator